MTTFFLKHPIISWILNLMIVVIGLLSLRTISLREYPKIDIPSLSIRTTYHNAGGELVESAITAPLEEYLSGVEGLETITSHSSQEKSHITLTFVPGTSMDRSLILVRDALNVAKRELPKDVKDPVLYNMSAGDESLFMTLALFDETMSLAELTHHANLSLKNMFKSIPGVARVDVWGQPYVMNVVLDSKAMFTFGVNPFEVLKVLRDAKPSWPVGTFRETLPMTLETNLHDPMDFDRLCVKTHKTTPIYLKHLGTTTLETDTSEFRVKVNGKRGVVLRIYKSNDGNPLDVSKGIQERIKNLQLPDGMRLEIACDQSRFIEASLSNVISSVWEAVLCVLLSVFVFLRQIRPTLIPLITIPVSLLGAVTIVAFLGGSINILTLLAMVLAVGLVVDDAIVVLEHISALTLKGMTPFNAAIKGARDVSFPVVAMTLTLASVYIPIAFMRGVTGQLFVEFAIALSSSVIVSGIVALTLSPLMCATLLKSRQESSLSFQKIEHRYATLLEFWWKARYAKRIFWILLLSLMSLLCMLLQTLPREMAPKEDRGSVEIFCPKTPGVHIDDFEKKLDTLEASLDVPETHASLLFLGSWGGQIYKELKPNRTRSASQIVTAIEPITYALPSQDAWAGSWDSGLPGLGENERDSNLSLMICTFGSYRDLLKKADAIKKSLLQKNIFKDVRHDLNMDVMRYDIETNTHMISRLGITPENLATTIEFFFSGVKGLNFSKDNVLYPVLVKSKELPWTLDELTYTTVVGQRVSLGVLAKMNPASTPEKLKHYNQMRSFTLSASLKDGDHVGSMMPVLLNHVKEFLDHVDQTAWTGAAKMHQKSSTEMIFLLLTALIFLYAILAVQFENVIDPLIIMTTVPLATVGALALMSLCGQSINIYTQIGLVTLMGLITKHGILMVDVTNRLLLTQSLKEAVKDAATSRLRPILMTTLAMVLGVLPLVLFKGAGCEARRSIGCVLAGGLISGTLLTLFVLPYVIYTVKGRTNNIHAS